MNEEDFVEPILYINGFLLVFKIRDFFFLNSFPTITHNTDKRLQGEEIRSFTTK